MLRRKKLPALDEFHHELSASPRFRQNIVSTHIHPANEKISSPLPPQLEKELLKLLKENGIEELYSHQAKALNHIFSGKNVVISSGVASGKSLIYQIPILQSILQDKQSRALLLFPTKALTQDQALKMGELGSSSPFPIRGAIYDGDTPSDSRHSIRKEANIVFSNPDMLHLGILPHHGLWSSFFSRLKYVVIDEVHYYRGVFGSHFACVIRRLKRICRIYNVKPIFICTSATLANAQSFVQELIADDVIHIAEDGSPQGERINIIYNPPLTNKDLGIRRSSLMDSGRIARLALKYPLQSILFSISRRSVETLLLNIPRDKQHQVQSYRSGYLPSVRRKIERKLREGEIKMVVSTNALELGIDIGGLDLAIINGYPGSISGVRQEAGRAGREGRKSLAILVASANPLDQYICRHPEYLWENSPEMALIDPKNTEILLKHLHTAVAELSFKDGESFGDMEYPELSGYLDILAEDGKIRKAGKRYVGIINDFPAAKVSLRNASAQLPILHKDKSIGFVDLDSAHWLTHPHAIYLHEGESWIVKDLDLIENLVRVEPIEADYYTQAIKNTTIIPEKIYRNQLLTWGSKHFADVTVRSQVTGFKMIRIANLEKLGVRQLDLPEREMQTKAWWIQLSEETVERVRAQGLWNSDPNDYGKNWAKLSKTIRARDAHRCTHCGLAENKETWHVHHIVPFRNFDDPAAANHPSNLTTLCPRCHALAEQRIMIQSGISGMAYLIHNIAPFFIMCDPRDLGIHFGKESGFARGNYFVAIYDAVAGGTGLSKKLYDIQEDVLRAALEQVFACTCESGCPACTGAVSEQGRGAKTHAKAILKELLFKEEIPKG